MVIAPRQIITSPGKRGPAIDGVLLGKTSSYNAIGDPFKMAGNVIARKTDLTKIHEAGHEKNFSPSKIVKIDITPSYEHMVQQIHIAKNFRDEDGAVII